MRTNFVQTFRMSANRFSLNRTAMRVALIGLFITLAVGNAWGGGSSKTYYATMNVAVASTGGGTVYVNASGTTSQTKSASSTSSSTSISFNIYATASAGYRFSSWSGSGITFGSTTTANTTGAISSNSTSSPGTSKTATASFVAIEATAAPANVNIAAEDPSATYPANTDERTLTFTTTTSNALTDFTYAPANGASGKYTFANWRRVDATHVAVDFTFAGGGNYGGLTRVHQVNVTLKGKEHATTQTCTITTTFPDAKITDGSAEEVFATYSPADATQEGVEKTAVFDVEYVDGVDNFDTPTFTGADASHFTYNSMSYADGKLTVNYTYNGNKETGTHTATLTLKVNDAIGGTDATYGSKAITITAHNEEEATDDVSVTTAANVTTNYATFAAGLAAANASSGCTLKLLRNVDLGTITATNNITKAMTIDLNGKELRAAVNAASVGILTITQAVAVTIKDSKTGGRIINEIARNSEIRTIFVNKAGATLTLESGTLAVNNTGQYASAANADLGVAKYASCSARTIHQIAGTTVNIDGGRVEAYGTRSVYGILQASSAATNAVGTSVLNITGGEIYAEGPYSIMGVYAYGKVNLSGGTITAHVNTNMIDARYAAGATQNKYNGYGYGIYLNVSASATATSCYGGIVNMTGGTINVTNDRSYNGNYPNYGILFNAAAANVSSATAVAADGKSRGQIASATGSIDGGEINVTSGTQNSYGVYVLGSYNSYDNTNHVVQIKNCKITSKAYVSAYGVAAWGAINSTNGACYAGDVELTNCDVYAESLNTTSALAVWAYATSATIFKDGTTANAATWGGEFAVAGKVVINSGKYEAKSKTSSAYAAGTSTRAKTTYDAETTVVGKRKRGGKAEAYPILIIHGGTFKATSTTSTARGVSNGGYCTIDGGEFEAYATTTTAHGLYCVSGKLTASGVKVSASATGTSYGAIADAGIATGNAAQPGYAYAGELELNNCDITATTRTGTEARGVVVNATNKLHNWAQFTADSTSNKWAAASTAPNYRSVFLCTIEGRDSVGIAIAGKATINGGKITATAATNTAYGIYAVGSHDVMLDSIATPRLTVKNATIDVKTNGTTTANGIYTQGETFVDGCDITVTPKTTTGYGIQALAPNGEKVTVKNTKITVTTTNPDNTASAAAYGIYGQVEINATHGLDRHGNLVLEEGNDVNVSTTSGTTAYAVFLNATKRAITATTNSSYRPGNYANAATAIINGGKYTAHANGTTGYAVGVAAPQTQGDVTAIPSCIINGGKFKGTAASTYADLHANGEPGYFVLNGGYYVKDENIDVKLGEGMNKVEVKSGTPEYTEGYRWRVTDNMTGEIVCKVYNSSNSLLKSYQTLEEALAYVNLPANSSTAMTIVMCGNYTLSKGDYSLPNGKTLLVPYKASGTGKGATQAVGTSYVWVNYDTKFIKPTPLYKLTFASGVNMTVESGAAIEASSVIYITNGASGQGASLLVDGTGIVHDKYGWIDLEEGSHIDLESGSNLYVWGYITGKGEINAKNGSKIYEDFQMGDWRGGTIETSVQGNKNGMNSKGVFPITHYYYQNIECPITYRAGATAYALGGTAVNAFGATNAVTNPAVQFIGTSNSMFLMDPATAGEDTWVRKEYDPETDYMNWTLNSGASIGSISLKMSAMGMSIDLNSSDYVLPITSNFNIIANYGQVEISNDVCFIPGSKLTIKKEATVIIPSGKRVYFYDQDDWKSYSGYWFNPGYSPSWKTNPRRVLGANTSIKMPDAAVLVEGVLDIQGYAYTTAGGANIYSTRENAGKVKFTAAAPASTAAVAEFTGKNGTTSTLCQLIKAPDSTPTYEGKALNAPWLKNEDGVFSQTTGTTTNKTWIYMEDDDHVYRWILSYEDGCFTYKNNGGGEKQLIHPSDWVAAEINTNGDHAYHSEDGTRMFVNAKAATSNAGCVWWEVDPTPEIISGTTYYVANNENFDNFGTYFYWDNGTSYWKPKKITVTWNNWDGSKLTNGTYGDEYSFNTSPVYQGTNPTRANTTTEKYDWIGWRDAEGNIYDRNATLPRATSNVTYTAYFVATKYQHTITFKNKNDNKVIWSGLMDAGTIPVCPVAPTQDPTVALVYTFTNWEGYAANADLPTVTEPATYTAIYSSAPRQYTVTFYNYDAASVLYETDVDYNTRPVYGGVTPFRANTSVFSYEWTGWQQGANTYDTDDDLALVTGDVYYVATFAQTELKYQVLFKRQDGSIIDAPFFSYEETPTAFPANPTLASTVSTDYTFREWSPATLVPVTEDGKVYTALFDESVRQYTAHFANYDGTTLNVDQTIDYNTAPTYTGVTPFKPNDTRNSYEFAGWAWEAGDGWEAGSIGIGEAFPAIKGDITFTAQYNPVLLQFDVIYQREDGTVILRDKKKWGESTAFPTSGLDYEDATYSYTFDHWSPATLVNPVTTNATYTAYFNQSVKSYSISAIATTPAGYGTVSPASLASIPGGSAVTVNGNEITVNGTIITATPAAATAQYTYAFDHWNNVPATVTSNISDIEAVFTRTVNQYDVTFNMKGHGAAISSQTKDYGSKVDQPADPSEAGYTFVGWYKEDACTNAWNFASDEVTDATTLFAKWTVNSYTITFDGNGGSAVASITQNYGTAVTPPANPTRTGYTFAGWLPEVPATMPVDGATCVAQWTINSYQIKFVDEDGTTNLGSYPQTLDYGAAVTAPEEPTKAADATNVYTFAGWSDGVSTYASADIPAVSGAVTYTATYNSAPTVASVTVGGATTYYATLQAAFNYAADKTTPTITVLKAVSSSPKLTYTNSSNTTVTFDLNGYKVAGSANPLLYITGNNSGKFIIKDGSVEKTGQLYNSLNANAARACVHVYNCPTEFQSGTIYMENTSTSTSSSVAAYGVNVRSSRKFDMTGGTIKVVSKKSAQGIYTAGTTTVSNGTIDVTETANGTAYGVHVINGTTTINGNVEDPTYPRVSVTATKGPRGVIVGGLKPALNSAKTSVSQYNGKLYVNGGTYTVTASADETTAYGVYAYRNTYALNYSDNATCPGNYVSAGTATVTAGDFTVTASGADATAYGVCIQSATSIQTALQEDGTTKYAKKTATPKGSITGGKYIVSGATKGAVNTSSAATAFTVQGGWYNIETGLATYTAPAVAGNYRVLDLTGEDPYMYEVAEAYTIIFNNYDGTPLQSSAVKKGATPVYSGETPTKAEDASYTYTFDRWDPALASVTAAATYTATFGSTPRTYDVTLHTNGGTINVGNVTEYTYGTGATLPTNVTKDGHEFGGWFDNDGLTGDAVTTISTTATGDKTFWAKWISSGTGPYVDIVDVVNTNASSGTLTLNVTNWPSAGWPYTINGVEYANTDREDDRTLIIPYTGAPGADFVIDIKKGNGDPYSLRSYKIPEVISSATLEDDKDRPLFVKGGTLTINGNITTKNIYVGEDAKLVINEGKTLTADTIFLRTTISGAAQMVKNGSIASATKLYYTRIIKDKSRYYQFGLPLSCSIDAVKLSDGKVLKYSSAWLLREYSESSRAQNGGSANNWTSVADHATIMGGKGYEMFSASNYYREFYFPVDHTQLESNTSVAVSHTTKGAATDRGWNVLVSPLTATCERTTSPEGVSVCWMESDGWGVQEQPTSIPPAKPFAYQAYENQSVLSFLGANIILAPRRVPAAEEPTQIQWIHLDVLDANRIGDQTSIYVHPTRYEEVYQGGIDVAKQALTASRAVIYSSHAYGDMAFAGVADSLLETGVALTVYSPKAQELMITMRENDWLDRMEHVWLVDRETGMRVDLLWSDYAFRVQEGTTRGRLFIEGAFRAPQVTTDIEPASDASSKGRDVRKVIINDKIYILVNGRMYDSTGKLVKEKY